MKRIILLVLIGLLFLTGLITSLQIIELRAEEPRRAIVSIEMMKSHQYIIPRIHDCSYYNKPPGFNWIQILFFKLTGSFEEWVVRLPSLLAFLATGIMLFFIGRKYLNQQTGIIAMILFFTSGDLLFYGAVNLGEIDIFLTFIIFLQFISFFYFSQNKKYFASFFYSYTLCAFGFLVKGIPVLVFQGVTILVWLIYLKQFKKLFSLSHIISLLFFLSIIGIYLYFYSFYDDPAGFVINLFKESSQRSFFEYSPEKIAMALLEFPMRLFVQIMAPWFLLLPFLFKKNFIREIKANPLLMFSFMVLASNIVFYWLTPGVKNRYLYPFLPFIAIITAHFYITNRTSYPHLKRYFHWAVKIISAIVLLTLFVLPFVSPSDNWPNQWLHIVTAISVLSLLLLFQKTKSFPVLYLTLIILLIKIDINFTYLKGMQQNSIYRKKSKEVLAITGDKPVYLTGKPNVFESSASIGSFTWKNSQRKFMTPPLIHYQIPYYLTKGNGHIMKYDPDPENNKFYMAWESEIDTTAIDILYRYTKMTWRNEDMLLFTLKE